MPIYTYRCENCGVQFERNQKFSDVPLTRCPECGKKSLRKVYMPVGIVFKGSGFYATDNRSPSGGGRVAGGSHSEEKSSEGKSSEGKSSEEKASSETKPVASDKNGSSSSQSESK
ncbi:MAG: zinc ribbon domain-containing protein [Anaerolineaceae bacterium]|nr:zinc ribbon domain-containing protein [Anaerolineaceae bacterium]